MCMGIPLIEGLRAPYKWNDSMEAAPTGDRGGKVVNNIRQ